MKAFLKTVGPVVVVAIVALFVQALSPLRTDAPVVTGDDSPGALLMKSVTTPAADASVPPVISKDEAAFTTNTAAAGWCGLVRRGSQTHKCTYPSLAATKGTCKVHIVHLMWLVRCDMRYWVTEKWGRYIYIYGCAFLVHRTLPLLKISGYCVDGPPRLIKKATM